MSRNIHYSVEGEASESDDDEQNNIAQHNSPKIYGIAVDGEASESDSEDNSNQKSFEAKNQNATSIIESKYVKGIESDKICFILTEFKCLIWDNMRKLLTNNLLSTSKELRNADKILLNSQMTLQTVSYNLQICNKNIAKLFNFTERLKTSKFVPNIKI